MLGVGSAAFNMFANAFRFSFESYTFLKVYI